MSLLSGHLSTPLSPSLSLTHTYTHSLSLSLTHTHTHTHTQLTAKMTQIEKRFGYLTHQLQVSRDLKSGFAEQSDTQPNPPKSSLL